MGTCLSLFVFIHLISCPELYKMYIYFYWWVVPSYDHMHWLSCCTLSTWVGPCIESLLSQLVMSFCLAPRWVSTACSHSLFSAKTTFSKQSYQSRTNGVVIPLLERSEEGTYCYYYTQPLRDLLELSTPVCVWWPMFSPRCYSAVSFCLNMNWIMGCISYSQHTSSSSEC